MIERVALRVRDDTVGTRRAPADPVARPTRNTPRRADAMVPQRCLECEDRTPIPGNRCGPRAATKGLHRSGKPDVATAVTLVTVRPRD